MVKRSLATVILLIFALTIPLQTLAQYSKAEQKVRAVLDKLNQGILKGGAEAITISDKYLADDFVRIPGTGAIYNKADVLDGWRTENNKTDKMEVSDVNIHIYGNTAVVTGVMSYSGSTMGVTSTGQNRWTRVLVKNGGVWQCVLYQNTRIGR